MSNPTAAKFGHPQTLVAETGHWLVLVRPNQLSLGSLVLVCKDQAVALAEISAEAFAELKPVTARIETLLKSFVDFEKINYMALMMVDPDVHFHVVPRYSQARRHGGVDYPDAGWPGVPRFDAGVKLEGEALQRLAAELRGLWEAQGLEPKA